ncbi:MAG: 50S ribosomal protein L23 [Candidatus Moranbacteria bacterium CG06_land_8_20_14_3_00_40_12]|nr:MAG: 50S ribosomal protein L23 [Candidatus Moranbacteria bacterium CG23_combo_of_CG06-09_8_20_14_all_40_16]PIU80709.1 MAG: 50S ribosomal protein L23 [Candidatus Moranbacteria bacterium CG06_land_8_20_14_3_00_40_12]
MSKEIKKSEKKQAVEKASVSDVLLKPWITESSTNLAHLNKYVFLADKNSNKKKIAQAVENLYQVTVEAVNIINMPRKKRVYGRTSGWKTGFKKALITLKKDDKIDLFKEIK